MEFPDWVRAKEKTLYIERRKLDYLSNCKSEISNVCNAVEDHCLQAMKTVHHYANCCFNWLISGKQSVNPSRKEFLHCLGNTKDFRLSILWPKIFYPTAPLLAKEVYF